MSQTPESLWVRNYRSAEQLGQEVRELINERNNLSRSGSNPAKVQSMIRVKLDEFSKIIKNLQNELKNAPTLRTITAKEVDRRQNMIDSLLTTEKQLKQAFNPQSNVPDFGRSALINQGYNREAGEAWGAASDPDSADLSPEVVRHKQQQLIAEQDKGLEELSKAITRQKMMGQAIGDELDNHNELVDEIMESVDTTNQKLIRTTQHTAKITKKSGSCALMVIIVLLLIAIVVVASVPK